MIENYQAIGRQGERLEFLLHALTYWSREPLIALNWFEQWFIVSCGVATFFLAFIIVGFAEILSLNPLDKSVFITSLYFFGVYTVGLGFLFVWKRSAYGRPVRLFLSGVVLPALIVSVARVANIVI